MRKTRPCLVVSPDETHLSLRTVIVAPMTTAGRAAGFRVPIRFQGKAGLVVLDQIRALDKTRLIKRLGKAPSNALGAVLETLQEMFAP